MKDEAIENRPLTALLPWHAGAWQQLQSLQAAGRLGHAWLLSGMPGIGKQMLAQHFARFLLCTKPVAQQPCSTCSSCMLFAAGTHPDFRLVVPEKKLITIEQIRDSIEFAHNTSQRGGMQVLVFDPAEALNANAANALLKLLEEPPAHTLLLLISHQPGLLLATLRSRCQQLRCPLPAPELAAEWLVTQGLRGNAPSALQKAGGAPLRALSQDDGGTLAERLALLDCLQKLAVNEMYPVEAAKKCEKFSIIATIDYLLLGVADMLRACQAGLPLWDTDLDELVLRLRVREQPEQMAIALHAMHGSLMDARKVALASNNANPLLLLEALFVKWNRLGQRGRQDGRQARRG